MKDGVKTFKFLLLSWEDEAGLDFIVIYMTFKQLQPQLPDCILEAAMGIGAGSIQSSHLGMHCRHDTMSFQLGSTGSNAVANKPHLAKHIALVAPTLRPAFTRAPQHCDSAFRLSGQAFGWEMVMTAASSNLLTLRGFHAF